ncbi:DNA topoisomerase [Rhynchospora pubera]|uniref:DNA topoisomerase n=1 Tax=Rhynchospora pubera TaxID=906938 RepID=A0AAV8H3S6_9POAL|nr:DNA topoisomerase [Rhynchospora pubera]
MDPASGDEADLEFLRSVDQAELDALSVLSSKSKRQRVTLSQGEEGAYTSALKGSHSVQWKESDLRNKSTDRRDSSVRNEGGCFKCGEMGHWARDCPQAPKAVKDYGPVGAATGEEAELYKECPCGAGRCLVLTSNTVKNPGRRFFRCPVKSDMGGCNFFEWCDTPQNTGSVHPSPTNQVKPPVDEMMCPCGAGPCPILTTKNGKNVGRQFWRCPASSGGDSCGFFKWCDNEQTSQPTQVEISRSNSFTSYSSAQVSSGRRGSSSSCFRCGGEGHWARDCPNQTPDSHPDKPSKPLSPYGLGSGSSFGSGSGSGTCFNYGQTGHWSRDCPSKTYGVRK